MIINLTQHPASQEQVAAGVVAPAEDSKVKALLNFGELPTKGEIEARAEALASIAAESSCSSAMIGGALFLMPALVQALRNRGFVPCSPSRFVRAGKKRSLTGA